eukprot:Hpha_TRINITY_DN23045_c0_g1::TRINITY_DN23045_c0_g1_i1::g.109393::m.109393
MYPRVGMASRVRVVFRAVSSRRASEASRGNRAPAAALGQAPGELEREALVKRATETARRAEEHAAVDYLGMFEEHFGPKETWKDHPDEMFLRRAVAMLCRKIDDLRERIAAAGAHNRLVRADTRTQVARIPLLKREAWQSPDVGRVTLLADLKGLGYLGEDGKLKLPSSLLTTPLIPPPEEAGDLAVAESIPPVPAADAEDWGGSSPLIVDPLFTEVHAPQPVERAPSLPLSGRIQKRRQFNKLPSARRLQEMAKAQNRRSLDSVDESLTKYWARFPNGEVEFNMDGAGHVTRVEPSPGFEHFYLDPSAREFADTRGLDPSKARAELPKDKRQLWGPRREEVAALSPANDSTLSGEHGGKTEEAEKEAEGSEGEDAEPIDPILQRALEVRTRRRRLDGTQKHLYQFLREPKVKPADAVGALILRTVDANVALPFVERLDAVERSLIEQDGNPDLSPASAGIGGPDAMDFRLEVTSKASRETLRKVHAERRRLRALLHMPVITGSRPVPLLPHSEGQLPFRHNFADADGIWYTVSRDGRTPGRPLHPNKRWPRGGAVKVPFKLHAAARMGRGYEAVRAKEEILRITAQRPRF